MVNDPIADLLTRIRNGQMVKKEFVDIMYSKIIEGVIKILKENGYIKNFKIAATNKKPYVRVYLKYEHNRQPVINELKRVSRPGLRKYTGAKMIKPFKNGIGMRILTTPKGILSDKEVKKENVGGEILCEIW